MLLTDSVQHISGQSVTNTVYGSQTMVSASVPHHASQQMTLQLPSGDFGDDLKRMNAERVKLDEELRETENKEIKIFVDEFVSNVAMLIHLIVSFAISISSFYGILKYRIFHYCNSLQSMTTQKS